MDRTFSLGSRGKRKAQANPIDFMAAILIFLVVFGYFMILWSMFSSRYYERADILDCELSAIAIADRLVSSGGYGPGWAAAPLGAESVGFAKKRNELDWGRIVSFASLQYGDQKRLLGTAQDFLIKIEDSDGASYIQMGQMSNSSVRSVEVTRLAMLNGRIVNLRVRVHME